MSENKLLSDAMQTTLVFAARYAHSRETGGAYVVVNAIIQNWELLSDETQKQLKYEAKNEATCNYFDWDMLINKELSHKGSPLDFSM